MQVVITLREQPRRFDEIKRHVGGISQQMPAHANLATIHDNRSRYDANR